MKTYQLIILLGTLTTLILALKMCENPMTNDIIYTPPRTPRNKPRGEIIDPPADPIFTNIEPNIAYRETSETSETLPTNSTTPDSTCNFAGYYFISNDMNKQLALLSNCYPSPKTFKLQCVLIDLEGRIAGVQYLMDKTQFANLPKEERKLWHSYKYPVKSGLLMPTDKASEKLIPEIMNWYGKAVYVWGSHDSTVPIGAPKLLLKFAKKGQVDTKIVDKEEMEKLKKKRKGLNVAQSVEGADAWMDSKKGVVFNMEEKKLIEKK